MTVLVGKEIGLERLAYAVLGLLIENLNTAIDAEDDRWDTLDSTLALSRGIPNVVCTSEHIQSRNFFPGHRPSLLTADIDFFPNVSVMAFRSSPSVDQGDHYYGNQINLGIEAMVIAGPYDAKDETNPEGEELVNRKAPRMLEAINSVIESNRSLGGIVFEITGPPSTLTTECLRRRAQKGHGQEYYWQMVRLDYTVHKISAY